MSLVAFPRSTERGPIDSRERAIENDNMVVQGRVQNGVVVFPAGCSLPEGVEVSVSYSASPMIHVSSIRQRVQLPLVKSARPGSLELTNDRIAEILDQQDASS